MLPYEVRQRLKRRLFHHVDMRARLENLRRAGFQPSGAIDVGAYAGSWSRMVWSVWPSVPVVMFEPLPSQTAVLERLATAHPPSRVVAAAVGEKPGSCRFVMSETNSRIDDHACSGETLTVSRVTLDDALATDAFLPNLAKLDVQGGELAVLAGAANRIGNFEVIILEASILRIGDVPIFREVDRYLEGHGFRLYDILPQYYRPRDGALWQVDAFYVREESPLVASREWA